MYQEEPNHTAEFGEILEIGKDSLLDGEFPILHVIHKIIQR